MRAAGPRPGQDRLLRLVIGLSMGYCVGNPHISPRAFAHYVLDGPRVGLASWYSDADPGVQPLTANGEAFTGRELTAAMWGVPFDACMQVTNLRTLEQVVVRVNDRGPHPRLVDQGRVIDLSQAAFARLADPSDGLIPVRVERCPGMHAGVDTPNASS